MLAKAVFDPSGEGQCAQVKIATDAKEWASPKPGEIGLLAPKGGGVAILIEYRELITTEDGRAYWAFDPLDESPRSARLTLRKLLRAYRPPPKAPTLPGMGEPEDEE